MARQARAELGKNSLVAVTLEDPAYPPLLRSIFDPPPVLFASAPLPGASFSAVVGTRKPSALTLSAVRHLVRRAPKGRGIVSGFARGVDFEAHRESLRCGLPAVAVLGSGVLCAGPDSSRALLEDGLLVLVSEFLPSLPAMKYNFPRRNRIIAGMAEEVFLLEAPSKSGSLITARFALEEGRELYVFDHPILTDAQNAGGRALLFEGADLLEIKEVSDRIVERPPDVWPPGQAQLDFFRKKRAGLSWLRDDYYIEE